MTQHITNFRDGFPYGRTQLTSIGEAEYDTGISVAVMRLKKGEEWKFEAQNEIALLLMDGKVDISVNGQNTVMERSSLFDESASAIHGAQGMNIAIKALSDVEFTQYEIQNEAVFETRFFTPQDVPNEHRGEGQVGGTCLRFVRTIFDGSNSPAEAKMVLGEVVTMPGRWSSYPPHHHPQPEIYHYRFTKPQGFGFSQLGEDGLLIRNNDVVKIFDGEDHAQTAAPGYGMYYSWVIRHLDDAPYTIPDFTKEHQWTMEEDADFWVADELKS